MKKLNDLKAKRNELSNELKSYETVEEITDEVRSRIDEIADEVKTLDSDIQRMELIERVNILTVEKEDEVENRDEDVVEDPGLIEGLRSFFETGVAPEEFRGRNGGFLLPFEERADLTLSVLGADNKNKTVVNDLVIAKTPAETLLGEMGVTVYNGLNGDFVVPTMAQVNAGFVAETSAVSDASPDPGDLKLAARRLGAYAVVTKEVLANSNPAIWQGIINDIRDAYYRAQVADLFDQIQVDAVDSSTTIAGSALAYEDLVTLQANVPYDLARPTYVATPAIAAYLKKTATIANVNGPVWNGSVMNGTIDGIPAFGTTLANADHLIYADMSKAVVGNWGTGVELLLNPYEYDVEGKIKVTISGLTDTGFVNANFASWIADVSIS